MDNSSFDIFKGAPAPFLEALPLFSGITVSALPVRPETAGQAQLYTLSEISEDGQTALPAFTSEELLAPPLIRRSLADTAALFFHAPPGRDLFIFNPLHPQALARTAPLKASRREISLLAGFIGAAGKNKQEEPARLADGEFAAGNLHAAHYLYAIASARDPGSFPLFRLGAVLVELGLLQEAYDLIKDDTAPEALLCLASIHRRTGNTALARKTLAALGPGTRVEGRREMETAWLDIEDGKEEAAEKVFQRLSSASPDRVEALSGLGAAMEKTAFRTKDRSKLTAAAAALRSALATASPASARVFSQLGNLYFRSAEAAQAEACYKLSAALAPAVQTLANLALTLIKTGKQAEAAAVTAQVALTDIASARRLAAGLPKDSLEGLFRAQTAQPREPRHTPQPAAQLRPVPAPESPPAALNAPAAKTSGGNFPQMSPPAKSPPAPAAAANLLFPARPQAASVSGRRPGTAAPAPELRMETLQDAAYSGPQPTEEESRRDDFISRAFRLASEIEDETGRKIYFNPDGLNEIERRLRLKFMTDGAQPHGKMEMVRDCSAFLCYFLQERLHGRLLKMTDFDPWGWPMVFERPGLKVTTYPVQRAWRLLWEETVPETGWLTRYSSWLADRLKDPVPPVCGVAAARAKVMSHPERLIDAQTEHRRMLVLISSLNETSGIEIGPTGLKKLETAIKNDFSPDVPPTTDGWKLLRCYGHLLAAILAKDFKAVWYNTDGEDGGWSMRLPWKTFVFPLGKVYKTASLREDLGAYYEALLDEKLKSG